MRTFLALTLVAAVTCLTAADPVWESKPASQWTEEDARQVLERGIAAASRAGNAHAQSEMEALLAEL